MAARARIKRREVQRVPSDVRPDIDEYSVSRHQDTHQLHQMRLPASISNDVIFKQPRSDEGHLERGVTGRESHQPEGIDGRIGYPLEDQKVHTPDIKEEPMGARNRPAADARTA